MVSYKFTPIFLCLLLLTGCLFAHDNNLKQLSGTLTDSTNQAIIGAVVYLTNNSQQSNPATAVSDNDGYFHFAVPKNTYQLSISYFGTNIYQTIINLDNDTALGLIKISNTILSHSLEEITIKADKPRVRLENGTLVFTPNIVSAGSAWDILKITPLLQVSNGDVRIVGKGLPKVKVDGKEVHLSSIALNNYLKNIAAINVAHIEVEKNALAEEDADNQNGFINIVLKKRQTNGFDGSAYLVYEQATYPTFSGGANFNLFSKKLRWSSSVGYSHSQSYELGTNKIHYPSFYLEEHNTAIYHLKTPTLSSTLDYQINAQNELQAGISYNQTSFKNEVNNLSSFFSNNNADSTLNTAGTNPQNMRNLALNVYYVHKFDTLGKQLVVDANHVRYGFERSQELFSKQFDHHGDIKKASGLQNGNDQNMQLTTLNIETKYPTKFARLSWGAKLTFIDNLNHSFFYNQAGRDWIPENSHFDHFNYYENTQALFAKGSKTMGKWNFTLGIRAENTQTKGESIAYQQKESQNYLMFFPSGNLSYQPNSHHTFSLTYTRNVTRPSFVQVNPFINYLNDYSYFRGNPFLKPFYSQNIDLMYLLKQKWSFDLSYVKSDKVFAELEKTEPKTEIRQGIINNFLDYKIYTLAVNTSYKIAGVWQLAPTASVSHMSIHSHDSSVESKQSLTGYLSVNNQINPWGSKNWFVDINGHYYFPNKSGIMQTNSSWGEAFGLTYQTADGKIQCSLSANDLWKTDVMSYTSVVNGISRERYKYNDSSYVMLTFRYNFSQGKVGQIMQRSKGNAEELRRL